MKSRKVLQAIAIILFLTSCSEENNAMSDRAAELPDFEAAWNYGAPEDTRKTFRQMLDEAGSEAPLAWALELKTQIARTHSLVGEFDEAHKVLDAMEPAITSDMPRVRVRYLLELGRTFNSSGDKDKARPLFVDAWEASQTSGEEFLAVDAAHMVAIAASDGSEANKWNLIGLEHARQSSDERARGWVGSLTNNMGWTAFDAGKLAEALALFEESRDHFLGRELPARAGIARWSIARVKREQGAVDEALAMQLEIRDENETAGEPDGFCYEELGELYLLKDDLETASENFAHAHALLSLDTWFVENEAARLARIETLSMQ